ncbi:hypothetical protein OGAPHI_005703 [Ogataea philodendri]|uniref:Uncharacterized protein n=1 Tax=Ogataea philodendri TaxID=1378263 RepID=A0A9P8T280_9ASCO|nr:uncharacterized protein OGAPHI_005703 [Ogataea philodendri]KAH3662451.1 hypothetical protein OGAPHI_005703 [Ogataea philodendri]
MSDDSSHLRSRPLKIGELIDKEDESDDTRSPELLIAAEALGALKNGSEQPKTTILDKMASHPLISNPINYMLEKTINTSSNIVLLADEKTKRARYEQSSDEVSDEKTQTETGTLHKRPRLEKSASGSQLSNRLPPPTQPRFARANSNLRQQVTISSAISTQKGLQDLTELSVLNLNIESRRRLTMLINFLKIGNTQLSERIENLLNALSAEQEKKSARSASPEENSVPTPAPV